MSVVYSSVKNCISHTFVQTLNKIHIEDAKCKSCNPHPIGLIQFIVWSHSGSVLGCIHHIDPRSPAPLIGADFQKGGVCSLQWSTDGTRLASGSPEGLLSVWGGDITGFPRSRQPLATMEQPTAVKVSVWSSLRKKTMTPYCIHYPGLANFLDCINITQQLHFRPDNSYSTTDCSMSCLTQRLKTVISTVWKKF